MDDHDCVAFLRWALPRLRLRWAGFRKVRKRVCKRIDRRCRELGLADVASYRAHLQAHADEWRVLDALCRLPISRLYRDRAVFQHLCDRVLPQLAAAAEGDGRRELWCWSAGCASGEEPWTLRILWQLGLQPRLPHVRLRVLATDADGSLLHRAQRACYRASSLRELPAAWRERAFARLATPALRGSSDEPLWCLRAELRRDIAFVAQDLRQAMPEARFDVVLCRNVAFTYFAPELQLEVARALVARLRVGGALVLGVHESLPVAAQPSASPRAAQPAADQPTATGPAVVQPAADTRAALELERWDEAPHILRRTAPGCGR